MGEDTVNTSNKVIYTIKKMIDKLPIIVILIYGISYLFPRDKKIWIFGSNMGKCFSDNPKYLYLFLNEHKNDEMRAIWISKDDSVVSLLNNYGYEAYSIYSLNGIRMALKGGVYIFDHHTKDITFTLSNGAIKINLFHGVPLKKIHGDNRFDEVRNPPNLWKKIRWTFRRMQNEQPSHYYLAPSQSVKEIFKRAFKNDDQHAIIAGYPRNDIFLNVDYLKNKKILQVKNTTIINKSKNSKLMMYMPTFRDSENKFFDIIDLSLLNDYLSTNDFILLIKAHPMSKLQQQFSSIEYSNILNINSNEDPYIYIKECDLLITDYSSIYFDFLITNKPIIFFNYDLEEYMSGSRELYYDYETVTPGLKARNMQELMLAIQSSINNPEQMRNERIELRNKMFEVEDDNFARGLYEQIKRKIYNNKELR